MTDQANGLNRTDTLRAIHRAMEEDLYYGPDITSIATVAESARAVAEVRTRQEGVVSGLEIIAWTLETQIPTEKFSVALLVDDGARVVPGDIVARIEAPTRALLTCERTFLNLIGHMSGISTAVSRWVRELEGTPTRVRDSRKTLPGMREMQKYAVRAGGGINHRMGLGDEALIKDNHVIAAGSVVEAYLDVRRMYPSKFCEVEVDSLEQFEALLPYKPDMILLDNFSVDDVATAVSKRNDQAPEMQLEASGGLTLSDARAYGNTGVDFVAVGALTHSVDVLDLGLDFLEQ
ncbi:carboxylating nicotinate-nucleotide diphosphorylase [Corynebacterium breve]|uniref:nicotinate-nucleotide diphosphorylase (carboxylating) n=1 Tax=Corynebacterium breve TaxID=3049799 RepID=A0ABY8VD78_9CORY|nr:carboxylating nicotinate-nucleotide diphosphorylase [Corynebacterium breve]WIM67067.1 carboxylating nicotinate-nucleotide diphosphorylase [Corynebacterium breve]